MPTSEREATQAGKDLSNPRTPIRDRGPIASALAQTRRKKRLSKGRSPKRGSKRS
jgi:hypothetical protein